MLTVWLHFSPFPRPINSLKSRWSREQGLDVCGYMCGPLETHGNAAACVHYLNKGNVYAATAFLHIDLLNRQVFSSIIHIFCGHLQYFMQ